MSIRILPSPAPLTAIETALLGRVFPVHRTEERLYRMGAVLESLIVVLRDEQSAINEVRRLTSATDVEIRYEGQPGADMDIRPWRLTVLVSDVGVVTQVFYG